MAFTPKNWEDAPATTTPITAGALEDLETRVTDYANVAAPTSTTVVFTTAAALQTVINSVSTAGGGTVFVKASSTDAQLDAMVTVPHAVNLQGEGPYATHFRCTTSGAGIAFGTPGATLSGLGNRGGTSGGFTLWGGVDETTRLATTPFSVNDCVQRDFKDIEVRYSAGNGITIRQAQNCSFENVNVESSATAGFLLDEGTGGHSFHRCESASNDGANLHVRNTATGPYTAGPTDNGFTRCIFERRPVTATEPYNLIFEAGDQFYFEACNLTYAAASTAVGDGANVLVDASRGTSAVGHLKFHNLYSFGVGLALNADVFQVKTFARISISGSPRFQNPGTKDPGRGGAGVAGGAEFALVPSVNPIIDVSGYKFSTYNTVYYDITAAATGTAGQLYIRRRFTEPAATAEFIEFTERSANPSAAIANTMKLFAIDNGAGKTRLSVYTPAGDIVPLVSQGGEITTVASASSITLFPNPNGVYVITGTTTITAITLTGSIGKPLFLKFSGAATLQAGATIKLAGGVNFVATADDVLAIYGDGTTIWELSRSVNA